METTHAATARKISRTLLAVQGLGQAAVVALFPIMAIVGAKLGGRPDWAGVPAMCYQLGQASAAYGWGYAMDPLGRRGMLMLGALAGAAGALISTAAVVSASFWSFLLGSTLVGVAISAVQLSLFVAAEVHQASQRARAISTVVVGGTLGAIFGPLIAGPMSRIAAGLGLDELSGPYGASTGLFVAAAAVIFLFLRPEPRDLSRAIAGQGAGPAAPREPTRTIPEIYAQRPAQVATAAMVCGQLVMVMLMVITPLHMRGHNHAISTISFVISGHVVGMYAFSVISGQLTDRWGRGPVIMAGGGVLILACLAATLSPQVLPLTVALFLLGLGWNLCYVGGSSLLADQLSPAERARTQGFNDLLIGLASAVGSLGSGIVFATIGYNAMGLVGAATALIPLTTAALWQTRGRAVTTMP
ncbi:MAG TPA: MFS transporter [bacterium]|nr:MFS transporter [bacterium]